MADSDVPVVGLVVLAVDGVGRNPVFRHESRRNVVLRAQRVAGAQHRVRPTRLQREHEVGRLRRNVRAGSDSNAFQRALLGEPLSNLRHDIHLASCPLDSPDAR